MRKFTVEDLNVNAFGDVKDYMMFAISENLDSDDLEAFFDCSDAMERIEEMIEDEIVDIDLWNRLDAKAKIEAREIAKWFEEVQE